MDKLSSLKFDNPNNACLSLRILAELVRQGEVQVDTFLQEAKLDAFLPPLTIGFRQGVRP